MTHWTLDHQPFESRLLLGTAQYPSPEALRQTIALSGCQIVTVSLRRQSPQDKGGSAFWDLIRSTGVTILPNTANCRTAQEAITTAELARDLFGTHWIKLEVIGDEYNLQPDPFGLVEAARRLTDEGFVVFPYCTDDLVVAQKLVDVGCRILMPWGAPIGTGQGLQNPQALKTMRHRLPDITLILDAGLGKPSQAAQAMELGFDGVLLNTAVALAQDPPTMAQGFARAVEAGRLGYEAGLMPERSIAVPSTPVLGTPILCTPQPGINMLTASMTASIT
ncbi:MAG: thiazole synthase [Cyanobacteria bacterium HKST-UBA03]|nr:thiazole synthase [Cyanobacteria bacterium HKST-UBA03]